MEKLIEDHKNRYANQFGYTDINPYEILSRTAKTITIREMNPVGVPGINLKFVSGGFSSVCVNQDEQKWIFWSNPSNPVIKAYLRKDGYYWSARGRHKLSDHPIKFYDYNF